MQTCLMRATVYCLPERLALLNGKHRQCCSQHRASLTVRAQPVSVHEALVGIDLGTSNSTIAFLAQGQAIVAPAADGRRSTPSVVSLSEVRPAFAYRQLAFADFAVPGSLDSLPGILTRM